MHTYLGLFFEVFHMGPSGPDKKLFNSQDSVFWYFLESHTVIGIRKNKTMQQFLSIAGIGTHTFVVDYYRYITKFAF